MQGNVEVVRPIYAAWERGEQFAPADGADPEIVFEIADGPDPDRALHELGPS